jgi:hypothetical protein
MPNTSTIGQRFGRWTVLSIEPSKRRSHSVVAMWRVVCDCGTERVSEASMLRRGKSTSCRSCKNHIRPYEALYNVMVGSAKKRNIPLSLTYLQFVDFTAIAECLYCGEPVNWSRHNVCRNGQNYNLDRKDNSLGYHKDNLVVCCTPCNATKLNVLTHEEMVAVGNIRRHQFGAPTS